MSLGKIPVVYFQLNHLSAAVQSTSHRPIQKSQYFRLLFETDETKSLTKKETVLICSFTHATVTFIIDWVDH